MLATTSSSETMMMTTMVTPVVQFADVMAYKKDDCDKTENLRLDMVNANNNGLM